MTHFWKSFQRVMGTQLMISTNFHPYTDDQLERTIQTLEDMLQACALNLKDSWEEHLTLVEFAYNNSYQVSIQMAPYEALYGRPCRSSVCWTKVGERPTKGLNLFKTPLRRWISYGSVFSRLGADIRDMSTDGDDL